MLLKIAFTLAVIAGVVVFFRVRRAAADGGGDAGQTRSLSPRVLVYALLGALSVVAALVYLFAE